MAENFEAKPFCLEYENPGEVLPFHAASLDGTSAGRAPWCRGPRSLDTMACGLEDLNVFPIVSVDGIAREMVVLATSRSLHSKFVVFGVCPTSLAALTASPMRRRQS